MLEKLTGRKIVCPWWLCFTFDNPVRKLLHDPETILKPYVKPGQRVVDIGAGMGYFSIPLAKLVGDSGHVTAIDIQPKMLSALERRAKKNGVSERITPHLAKQNSLDFDRKADFILAFWMAHEVPDQKRFFGEIYNLLNPDGLFLIVEPKIHVSEEYFSQTLDILKSVGFVIKETPEIRMSQSALLTIKKR